MKPSARTSRLTRRQFIATTAATLAAPAFIPASVLGAEGRPAPSERIVVGIVGWGMQGPYNTKMLMAEKEFPMEPGDDRGHDPLVR